MGKVIPNISENEAAFIAAQKVFFVATAPLSAEHHISVSPKAPGNSCIVLGPNTVAYADLTGSGAETAAHVLQNGRMTLLFCNLEHGAPKILRLHGKAQVIMAEDVPPGLKAKFPQEVTKSFGFRAVYKLNVHRVSSSCGFSLPIMEFQKYRGTLEEYACREGKVGIFNYNTLKNSFSIDGLPSLALLRSDAPKYVEPIQEEGFIFGKVTDKPFHKDAISKALKMHATTKGSVQIRVIDLCLLGMVVFAVGVVTGSFVLMQAKQSISV